MGRALSVFLMAAVTAFCLTSLRESRAQEAALETGVGDSESAVEASDLRRLLNQAEGMLWLGLVEKGNPRAFEEALHLVEQARKHLEASELSPPEQALLSERIDAVRDDAAFYIEYSPRRFYGAYPLGRVISPVLMAAANDGVTEQLVENPVHFAVRKASQAIDEYMIGFGHPHVTLRSEPADRALESIAIEVLAEAPRPYPHSRRELLDTLTRDELAAYDRGEVSLEIADRLMSAFGAKSLLVVSIVQSIELADATMVLVEGKFFAPDAAEPTDVPAKRWASSTSPSSHRFKVAKADRQALRPPRARPSVEDAGAPSTAESAVAVVGQVPIAQNVPIATDELLSAMMAVRAFSFFVMNVAGIRVANTVLECNTACAGKRPSRGGGLVEHLPVRMESGEVHGHVRA